MLDSIGRHLSEKNCFLPASGLMLCWSSLGFVCFQCFTRHTEADPSPVAWLWEAEVNVTWTYPLWLPVPPVSGVRYRSEGPNRNSGECFLEENHR